MRWMLAGGGTGGHLFPGLALADALRTRCPGAGIGFLGTPDGLERTLVPHAGYPLDLIAAGRGSPVSRHRPMNLPRFLVALVQCVRLLRKERPDALIVLGGYAGAAPGLAAGWLGIPLVILEQNTVPGRVNRMLARRARQIHLQFLSARERFGPSPATWYDSGSPMRAGLSALAKQPPCRGDALLVMGGSQGAQRLNDLVLKAMPRIREALGCRVIHLAGAGHEGGVGAAYREMGVEASVYGFCSDMERCYHHARLAVSRAGAGSLAELAAAGIPPVLLPLPSAMDDHQRVNAEVLVRKEAACMLDERTDAPTALAEVVIRLWKDERERAAMAEAIRRTARPEAADEIAEAVLSLSPGGATAEGIGRGVQPGFFCVEDRIGAELEVPARITKDRTTMFEIQGKRIHFMGCGGVGVSALAEIALARGAIVTGCDREENEMLPRLRQRGIPVFLGHDPRHAEGQDWLVHTSAVPPGHPERDAAGEHAMRRGTFLARLMDGMDGIGVCGTHGKTTTTWILAHLLLEAGVDSTVVLGGVSPGLGGNVRIGRTACFLTELDESDGSFLEPTLVIAVITNIESDHLAHYGTFERIRTAFEQYADGVKDRGVLVAGIDDPETARLVSAYRGRVRTFGLGAQADFRAVELRVQNGVQEGRIAVAGEEPRPFSLPLPGAHNVRNALAAVAVARERGIEWEAILRALATCPTVGRRMERVGVFGDTEVYSDYAHHPSEVRAAIEGARQLTDKPVHVAFQPHLFSRTRDYAGDFGKALAQADAVWVADIYPAREEPIPGVDAGCIVGAVRAAGGTADGPFPLSALASALRAEAGRPSLLICMGAGDIGKVPHDLVG